MPVITLLNGKKRIYQNTISLVKIAEDIHSGLSQISTGAIVNGYPLYLNSIINYDAKVHILTIKDKKSLIFLQYSNIQLLSYACKIKWKDVKIGIGGITKNGFFCDIDICNRLNFQDLIDLEHLMQCLIKKKYNIFLKYISKKKIINFFQSNKEIYKLEYIQEFFINKQTIPIYSHEDYLDIYLGPQLSNITFCSYFKLKNISGAYWKGNKKNKMLQRIYGVCWLNKKKFLNHLHSEEILKKKDHKILNKKMDLYHIEDISPGMIFWHSNGLIIFRELENFIRSQLQKWNYEEVKTPIILNQSIWQVSGHIENFGNAIFYTNLEQQKYCIKPMNCPGHIHIFNHTLRSYKDLPIRLAEFGICHRNETSGSLNGLLRLRSFTQDDAHIFCSIDQVQSEIINCINNIIHMYQIFGFKNIHVKFSTRPNKRIGDDIIWDRAELDLKTALLQSKMDFVIQEGEGAFYGPKIEFILEDRLNRLWQCGTIQLDFYLPHRFSACYIDKNNTKQTPIMIHRAILGSIERFIGILLEEYSGNLPVWLSPIQIMIININHEHIPYVFEVFNTILKFNLRVQYDIKNEKINFKIRKYTMQHIPYILICGSEEMKNKKVSIRYRNNNINHCIDLEIFIKKILYNIQYHVFNHMEV